jgi:hypothetical protein
MQIRVHSHAPEGHDEPAPAAQPRVGRRTNVVGVSPDNASPIRLATSLVLEQYDDLLVRGRHLSLDSLAQPLEQREGAASEEALAPTAA